MHNKPRSRCANWKMTSHRHRWALSRRNLSHIQKGKLNTHLTQSLLRIEDYTSKTFTQDARRKRDQEECDTKNVDTLGVYEVGTTLSSLGSTICATESDQDRANILQSAFHSSKVTATVTNLDFIDNCQTLEQFSVQQGNCKLSWPIFISSRSIGISRVDLHTGQQTQRSFLTSLTSL